MKASTRLRFIAFLILSTSISSAAFGTTFPVTKTADTADGTCDADCSLREAIIAANANAGPDTIGIPVGNYALTRAGANEDASLTGDLDITGDTTITGAGPASTIIDAGGIDRVLDILGGVVNISGVTIRNGHPPFSGLDQGGGIWIGAANVNLTNVIVANNTSGGQGGGIFSSGLLQLHDSSVTGNTTTDQGGGIFAAGSTTGIFNSTISFNMNQDQGAGIFNLNGTLNIVNSTISNNTGTDNGGGLYNNPPPQTANNVVILGSTIADNSSGATQGGGIYNLSPGIVTVNGVILANNTGGSAPDCAGTITSNGYNLIENPTNCTIAGGTTGNKTGQDPQLLVLGNYGGPTETRKLGGTSPAIDMWINCSGVSANGLRPETAAGGLSEDQRGFPRPAGVTCDMGAFECQGTECAAGPAPTATPTTTPTVPAPTTTATPTVTSAGGAPPTVPTLSFPMLALLGVALAGAAIFLIKRS